MTGTPQTRRIALTVNGTRREAEAEVRTTLADFLRHGLGLTGTHLGCEHGVCGACTILFDGHSARSCLMLAVQADGHEVTTIEGIAGEAGQPHPLQAAFRDNHGLQCGFCTPGILTTLVEFLGHNPDPTAQEVRIALSGNLCRCTGYAGIVAAALDAAKRLRDGGSGAADEAHVPAAHVPAAVGDRLPRREDDALLQGRGRFIDDIDLLGMVHAVFVRSPHAHAAIKGIDKNAALAVTGVHTVLTLDDLRPHLKMERLVVGLPSASYKQDLNRPVLAGAEVVHVGEAVAIVVADSRAVAEDAAALVDVDYEIRPAAADCRDALAAGAPRVHDASPDNLLAEFDMAYGDTDAAFAGAAHVFGEKIWQHRGTGLPIECRGAVATFDPLEDRLTLWSGTQMPHAAKRLLANILGFEENRLRVVAPDIGGGFGPKLVFYPEDAATALAALIVGRPVKWIEDRREHFTATTQERDQYWEAEIAVDDDGRILGIRGAIVHDHGAYTARGVNTAYNSAETLPLPYEVPAYKMNVRIALTNKVPVTPLRGAGHPQGTFVMERLLDRVAQELGLDRAEVRRRNLIAPGQMPYTTALKTRNGRAVVLDGGDYPGCQEDALERAGWSDFSARQKAARAEGRYIGLGLANFVKSTGRGPFESATVRIEPSGKIQVFTGAVEIGQGTKSTLAQVVAAQLGGDPGNVNVTAGDTAAIALGMGAMNSRLAVMAGSSAHAAATNVRAKALAAAGHMLEVAPSDLEIDGGMIHVVGAPDVCVSLGQVAGALAGTAGYLLPGGAGPGLEATEHVVIDDMTFGNGSAAVEVEVDIGTGAVEVRNVVFVQDCGRMINPAIVEGQLSGGIAHGIGNALYEWMGFDENAQPVTTTLAEYLVVGAAEMPNIEIVHHQTPTNLNPLGVKGVGESGVMPMPAAIMSAIEDALAPFKVRINQAPISPGEIVALIEAGRRARVIT